MHIMEMAKDASLLPEQHIVTAMGMDQRLMVTPSQQQGTRAFLQSYLSTNVFQILNVYRIGGLHSFCKFGENMTLNI